MEDDYKLSQTITILESIIEAVFEQLENEESFGDDEIAELRDLYRERGIVNPDEITEIIRKMSEIKHEIT